MFNAVLVDTDVLVDAGRGDLATVATLRQYAITTSLAASAVTQVELLNACTSDAEMQAVERFLTCFQIHPLDEAVSRVAFEIFRKQRLRRPICLATALLAATALVHDEALLTKSPEDYAFIETLKLLPCG